MSSTEVLIVEIEPETGQIDMHGVIAVLQKDVQISIVKQLIVACELTPEELGQEFDEE